MAALLPRAHRLVELVCKYKKSDTDSSAFLLRAVGVFSVVIVGGDADFSVMTVGLDGGLAVMTVCIVLSDVATS